MLLDDDGFLLPSSAQKWSFSEGDATSVVGLLAEHSSFVLLAAGGAGKSTVFAALAEVEDGAQWINAAPLTREMLSRRLDEVCRDGAVVYLDGLDQAAAVDPMIFQWLEDALTSPAARGVQWRLACRAAAWDSALSATLRRELPAFAEVTLLPLDKAAARLAVKHAVADDRFVADDFLDAISTARLGRLSACVGQLIAVARFWHMQGALPQRAAEAMTFEIEWLLKEHDSRRRPRMPADRAIRLAKRMGAFTMFAGAQALTAEPVANAATLSVDQLPSDPEPAEIGTPINPDDYRDVLATALFDPGPSGTVVFRHQRYVEYLAAAYLIDRDVTAPQLPALLSAHHSGVLPTTRIGVAAWLAALRPSLITGMIKDNALMFASAAGVAELPSDEARATVVKALLAAAGTGDASRDWSLDRSGLLHAGLGDKLAEHLAPRAASADQLWWIARLAAAGICDQVAPQLTQAALDTTWPDYARRAAVSALAVIGDEVTLSSLRVLLDEGIAGDADNQVRAAVIDALYPQLLNTEDLIGALVPHRSMLHGGYRRTLAELPDRVPEADLALFVDRLAERAGHGDHDADQPDTHFEDLLSAVLRRAWSHSDNPGVRRALARFAVASARTTWWHRLRNRDEIPWRNGDAARRRALVLDVAEVQGDTWYTPLTIGLLHGTDTGWLLDTVPAAPLSVVTALVTLLPQLLGEPTAAVADRILGLEPTHPAYDATSHLRGAVDIHADNVQHAREFAREEHEYAQRLAAYREQVAAALNASIDQLEVQPGSWWRIVWMLGDDGHGTGTELSEADLTRRPGWVHLDADAQDRVITAGIRYLHLHSPTPTLWATATTGSIDVVFPDWAGIYLMTTLAKHHPARLADLAEDVWHTWAHTILVAPMWGNDTGDVRAVLIDHAPDSVQPAILAAAIAHLDTLETIGHSLTPHSIYQHLLADLAEPIAARLATNDSNSHLAHELLTLLVNHGPPDLALRICRELAATDSPIAPHARNHLGTLDPNAAVDLLTAPGTDLASAEGLERLNTAKLDRNRLVRMTAHVLDAFPFAEDPPVSPGFAYTSDHDARDLRRHLLDHMVSSGYLDELTALAHNRTDTDQQILAQYQRLARAQQADLGVTNTDPHALLDLLRRADARLVRNDADLQRVIIEHLHRLQHDLTTTTAYREIWNDTVPQQEDDISDWVKRRLNERLRATVSVDREIQVTRRNRGIGTRIDLTVTTTTPTGTTARVIIEAKHANNSELMTAMRNQLINRYLIPEQRDYGIYLVYWVTPPQRPPTWSTTTTPDPHALAVDLGSQATAERAQGMHISTFVLDISWPN